MRVRDPGYAGLVAEQGEAQDQAQRTPVYRQLWFYVVAHTGARIVGVVALDAGNRELDRYP